MNEDPYRVVEGMFVHCKGATATAQGQQGIRAWAQSLGMLCLLPENEGSEEGFVTTNVPRHAFL